MRTCPACGEDTESGYAEPCTECGFSPNGEGDEAPVISVGDEAAADEPGPEAESESAPKLKRSPARLLIWLVALAALFGVARLGIFDPAPGPDADQVEEAIVDNAADYGATVTVACPDDADQTEVDASFRCVVTAGNRTFPIRVTNHEDNFSWPSDQFATLP